MDACAQGRFHHRIRGIEERPRAMDHAGCPLKCVVERRWIVDPGGPSLQAWEFVGERLEPADIASGQDRHQPAQQ